MMRRMDEFRKFLWKRSGAEYNTTTPVHPAVVLSPIGMWSAVTPDDINGPAPSARSKHSATLLAGNVYLLGGRNGNVPLKDFWKYNLAEGKWYQIQPNGERPPCLQEHTAVSYRDSIYVFGGEVGFSAGTETPLWVYDVQRNTWRKVRTKKGVMVPRGRRGHTALVHRGTMLIYGGYQDLRGSSAELWAFHFETESWHLISNSSDVAVPPARHKHSAIIHSESMWIYGGMTDLNERSDLWRWDTVSRTWTAYSKQKHGPGSLHSHAACRLPGSMILFGGETNGHASNDVWKFHFDTEQWEKLQVNGVKPQPRAECVALAISELLLIDSTSGTTLESRMARTRSRTSSNSGTDKNARPSSYIPQNKVFPSEKTYVFKPSQDNYTDGSHDYAKQYSEQQGDKSTGFLREISKLSQLNLSRLGQNKCSYTVLTTGNNDSTESLLRQHSTIPDTDSESATPTRMIKSKSAYVIKKKYNMDPKVDIQETNIDSATEMNTRLNSEIGKMTREPISVPNFSTFTMPTPVLTPVEAARLVFLDSEDEKDDDDDVDEKNMEHNSKIIHVQATSSPKNCIIYENFKTVKRGESYSSHLGYADNPLYQHMVSSASVKFEKCPEVVEILSDENISTSDYASIETMNRLSSSSSYSTTTTSRQQTPQDETTNAALFRAKNKIQNQIQDGPFGFCNPNYLGPDIQVLLSSGNKPVLKPSEIDNKKQYAKLLNTPDSVLEDNLGRSTSRFMYCEENLELQNMVNTEMSKECAKQTVKHHHNHLKKCSQPKSFEMDSMPVNMKPKTKCRASSASRIERHAMKRTNAIERDEQIQQHSPDVFVPLYIFIIGGKEHGQVTVFKRPVSIWKLKLF